MKKLLLLLATAILLTGCGGAGPETETVVLEVTATPRVVVATSEPSAVSPDPTRTPRPTLDAVCLSEDKPRFLDNINEINSGVSDSLDTYDSSGKTYADLIAAQRAILDAIDAVKALDAPSGTRALIDAETELLAAYLAHVYAVQAGDAKQLIVAQTATRGARHKFQSALSQAQRTICR